MASLASSSYRNSLSYILHPRVKCQHSAASHFIRRYFVLVRPAHARRRHVWPRQCLDETLTHTHTHTHNAPIGFGMWPSSSTGITTALVSPSPSFSFVSLFQDQDSTTCSLGPSTSPLRHTASCSGTMQHQRHRLALHHYPRLSPSVPRGPTPDAARQGSSRRKSGGESDARPTTQASYLICSCIAVCVRARPLSRKSRRPVPLWMMPRRLACRQCHAQADTAAQPPCRTDERQAGTAHQAVRQRHRRRRLRSRRVCTGRSMSPRRSASTYIGPEPRLDAHDCGATHLSCSLLRHTIHHTE